MAMYASNARLSKHDLDQHCTNNRESVHVVDDSELNAVCDASRRTIACPPRPRLALEATIDNLPTAGGNGTRSALSREIARLPELEEPHSAT